MASDKNIKLSKEDKLMISKLQSERVSLVAETIKEVKESGSVVIIPYLFEIIASNRFPQLQDEILRLISDIKKTEAAAYIIDSIKKYNFGERTAAIVASCWQSRLDFSSYLPVFAGLFFQQDYQLSIEAFTVIEESLHNASVAEKNECLKILNRNAKSVSEELRPLYNELRKVVSHSLEMTIDNQKNTS